METAMVKHRMAYVLMLAFFVTMWVIGEGSRKGSDDRAQEVVIESNSGYHRWFKGIWEPSATAEKILFAVQGAGGCAIGAYCLYQLNDSRKRRQP